jgi:hypothetical protein
VNKQVSPRWRCKEVDFVERSSNLRTTHAQARITRLTSFVPVCCKTPARFRIIEHVLADMKRRNGSFFQLRILHQNLRIFARSSGPNGDLSRKISLLRDSSAGEEKQGGKIIDQWDHTSFNRLPHIHDYEDVPTRSPPGSIAWKLSVVLIQFCNSRCQGLTFFIGLFDWCYHWKKNWPLRWESNSSPLMRILMSSPLYHEGPW